MNKPQILIVEDDNAVANLISATLETQDYAYKRAATGAVAVMEALSCKPDVVLLLDLNCADLAVIYHIDKSVVVNFLDLMLAYPRHCDKIEHQQKDEHYRIVIHQRLFGGFNFVHVFYSHQNIYCV